MEKDGKDVRDDHGVDVAATNVKVSRDEHVSPFHQQQSENNDNDDEDESLLKATIEVNEDMNIAGLDKCDTISHFDVDNTDIIKVVGFDGDRVDVSLTGKRVVNKVACSWRTCKSCKNQRSHALSLVYLYHMIHSRMLSMMMTNCRQSLLTVVRVAVVVHVTLVSG